VYLVVFKSSLPLSHFVIAASYTVLRVIVRMILELNYDFTKYPLLRHHMLQCRYHLVSISLYDVQKLLARHLAIAFEGTMELYLGEFATTSFLFCLSSVRSPISRVHRGFSKS